MKLSDFDYNLPQERIAQFPPERRGESNLLVVDRKSGEISHEKYFNIVDHIPAGDVVVLNRTKVDNIRTYFLVGDTQKRVEVLFLDKQTSYEKEESGREYWYVLIGRAKKVKEGDELFNEDGVGLPVKVEERKDDGFIVSSERGNLELIFEKAGHVPLPPYMRRGDTQQDKERYNTVFSKVPGSSAAPTASLNLTDEMLTMLEQKGVEIVEIELKVGWGTFAPIRTEDIEDHKVHSEYIKVTDEQADKINERIRSGGEVWAFGTTVARTLESVAKKEDSAWQVDDHEGETDLYIYPGYEWKIVDHLITNFHAPKSSLVVLVSSFAGYELIMKAYKEALEKNYNFLSYGDSMLIL
jgi:S-adenosylmethionine:tRNA ribosyltransferase-isomerase